MNRVRVVSIVRALAIAMAALVLLVPQNVSVAVPAGSDRSGVHGFDFQVGEWQVHHRLKRPTGEWWEFDGTCVNHGLMGGAANIEEHTFHKPTGIAYGVALRAYDSDKAQWSIWWLDSRYPSAPVDPPVRGHFENGVGTFYSDYEDKGKPMRVRFIWSQITATSARWEQAASADGGQSWDTNWIMTFQRLR